MNCFVKQTRICYGHKFTRLINRGDVASKMILQMDQVDKNEVESR